MRLLKQIFKRADLYTFILRVEIILLLIWTLPLDMDAQFQNSVEGDRRALVDLYNSTDGNRWTNNIGWLNGDPSSSWYGVEVDAKGRVIRLDLFQNGLSGNLPESIGNLTKVTYFNIKGNNMTGEVPSSIGNMENLEWLIMAGNPVEHGVTFKEPPHDLTRPYHPGKFNKATNKFTGSIPSAIGNLSRLKRFELSGTSITSLPAEIGNCTALEGLYVSWSDSLEQELPATIGNLINLRHLYLSDNKFYGDIPLELSNLTKLTFFSLGSESYDRNKLTGPLPDFSNATELRSFVVDQNDLTGPWPNYWNNGNFVWLNTLRGTWNNFSGTLHGFQNLTRMRSFDLSGNKLSGELPASITTIGDGECIIIGIGWNNFSGELPQDGWADFYQLRLLYLNNNNFTGNIPTDLVVKADNNDLKWLYFQNNGFTSIDPHALANLKSKNLLVVDISDNHLSFEKHIKPAVGALANIKFVYESQTPALDTQDTHR